MRPSNVNNSTIEIKSDPDEVEPMDEQRQTSDDDDICELEHLRKLFIGGLAPYTTEEGLKEFYGKWGNVVDVVVMRDPTTKRSRGFGFITYTKSCMVDKAQENRPHVIDGKTVEAKRALPRPERESREINISVKKLFVGGLKDNHDEPCLHEYFSQFGNVVSVKILTDKTTGKRRGFAFIEFDDYDAVDKAILQKSHSIKYVVVDVKKSVYQEQKQRQQNTGNNTANSNNTNQAKPIPNNITGGPPPPNHRPPPPQAMPPYQQPPPMHAGPPPPPNYNYWGPPPHVMQYGGYQQPPPPPPQMNSWGYHSAPPTGYWNTGPPPPPAGPAPSWQPSQWGGPPPVNPQTPGVPSVGMPPPSANWNAPQSAPPAPPPPGASTNIPLQQPPPNFGAGYQQNYGGGPTKHNMNQNRMNPYSAPPNNSYVGKNQMPSSSYSGYNNGANINPKPPGVTTISNNNNNPPAPVSKPITNGSGNNTQTGNKYRR